MPQDFLRGKNPFLDLLEEEPALSYYSRLYDSPYSDQKKRTLQRGFQESRNQYLGQLGSMIRQGQTPNTRYDDFLGSKFNFDDYYYSLSPYQRGTGRTSHLTPRVRQLLHF